jgi:hypothetical protein
MSDATNTIATATEWLAADRRGRNAIRRATETAFNDAMDRGDMDTATACMVALRSYVVPTDRPAPTVDWDAIVADRIASLTDAIAALRSGTFDGAPDGYTFDGAPGTASATDVARYTSVRPSVRRDLASYVVAAVTTEWRSVADIRRSIVAATDGDYVPSDGAVAAALFNADGTPRAAIGGDDDIVATVATSDRPRGAYRVA